ncbi:uncharacterized protein LAESUDRAFT_812242 [Laetiporus sulphureus 93-53]|uniref:F-box domain-containing protein n=1 Tax=Laetiporus sulphureus 93-53 TaxID=1314785 RepID=A0A165EKI8_9APHY|nr:uncharacterized protein LAESUDRAFT_812242 [Laetiporus sulphureus 93-53]KZT07248.1 hypothetical protein LAESUDRAFT_812242 [Laetiporus sulphureus 93-53]
MQAEYVPPLLRIPQEIHNDIMGHLRHDRKTLKLCSQVHRAWLPGARMYLFQTICIRSSQDCHDFQKLLDESSLLPEVDLTNFVRHIIFQDLPFRSVAVSRLAKSFCKLAKVEVVELRYWLDEELPAGLVHALSDSFPYATSLILDEVKFRDIKHLLWLLCAFPCLANIRIKDTVRSLIAAIPPMQPPSEVHHADLFGAQAIRIINVRSLTIENSPLAAAVASWVSEDPFNLQLQYLSLAWNRGAQHSQALSKLMRAAGRSLEHLKITFDGIEQENFKDVVRSFDQLHLTHLRSLHFTNISLTSGMPITQHRWMSRLVVCVCRESEHFQCIKIDLRLKLPDCSDFFGYDWEQINQDLGELANRFPGSYACVNVIVPDGDVFVESDVAHISRVISTRLYNLSGAGMRFRYGRHAVSMETELLMKKN